MAPSEKTRQVLCRAPPCRIAGTREVPSLLSCRQMDGALFEKATWPRAGMQASSLKTALVAASTGRMDRELRMLRLELELPENDERLSVDHPCLKDDMDKLQDAAGSDKGVDYDTDVSWNPGPYLDEKITDMICEGDWLSLQPNSGQSVGVREFQVCVNFQENFGVGYRSWEWHGHAMVSEGAGGHYPYYVYGNYLEPVYKTPVEFCKVRS